MGLGQGARETLRQGPVYPAATYGLPQGSLREAAKLPKNESRENSQSEGVGVGVGVGGRGTGRVSALFCFQSREDALQADCLQLIVFYPSVFCKATRASTDPLLPLGVKAGDWRVHSAGMLGAEASHCAFSHPVTHRVLSVYLARSLYLFWG